MPLALRLTRLRAAQLRRLLRDNAWAANAEMRNVKAVWPLHAAIFFSHEPCVALLLRAGANEDAKDCTGRSAMQAATTLQRDAIVALLRALAADSDALAATAALADDGGWCSGDAAAQEAAAELLAVLRASTCETPDA